MDYAKTEYEVRAFAKVVHARVLGTAAAGKTKYRGRLREQVV